MSAPRATILSDGSTRLENVAPWFVQALLEIPSLLAPGQSDSVDRRLFPPPNDDEDQQNEWRKLVHPELFALFASAREVVARDLATLEPEDVEMPFGPWTLTIPCEHMEAWMSALNAARLTIGEIYRIEETDMSEDDEEEDEAWIAEVDDEERPDGEPKPDPQALRERQLRRIAVTKIHLLGWIQQLLIEEHWPSPKPTEGIEPPEDPDPEPEPDQEG